MKKITREQFIELCNKLIIKTREDIIIVNQKSGYKKFHKELRDNDFLEKHLRMPLYKTKREDILSKHKIIKDVGIGHCQEIAEYLAVEISTQLQKMEVEAKVGIFYIKDYDHTFNRVRLTLLDEKYPSTWEIDAWDPRVIDISTELNGTIKNFHYLEYGYSADVKNVLDTKYFSKKRKYSFFDLKRPKEGRPERSPTPEREMREEDGLYPDCTIEEAFKTKKLCSHERLCDLQQYSEWQKDSTEVEVNNKKSL